MNRFTLGDPITPGSRCNICQQTGYTLSAAGGLAKAKGSRGVGSRAMYSADQLKQNMAETQHGTAWWRMTQHGKQSTAQHETAQHSMVPHSIGIAHHSTAWYSTAWYGIAKQSTACTAQSSTARAITAMT